MRLSTKVIILILVVVLSVGLSSSILVSQMMHKSLFHELEIQATLVAQTLSEHITHNVINGEFIPVYEDLQDLRERTRAIRYIYVIGFDGRLVAHTFTNGFPRAFIGRKHFQTPNALSPLTEEFHTPEGMILDLSYPLITGMNAHIHVGLDQEDTLGQIATLRYGIIGFTLLLGLIGVALGAFITRRITQPLAYLAESMVEFGSGGTEQELDFPGGGRETKYLTKAFNQMIADRKRAENDLQQSSEMLRRSQEIAHVGSWRLDWTESLFTWSDEVYRISGKDPVSFEPNYTAFLQCVHPEDRTLVDDAFHQALDNGQAIELEHRLIRPSGDLRIVLLKSQDTTGVSKPRHSTEGMMHDITDRKFLEDRLRMAQKMEAIGQLAGGVAHDFNNLLQVIQGFANLALADLEPGTPARAQLEEVLRATSRAVVLVQQLLAFSRRQVLHLTDLDLNDVVGDLVKMVQRVIGDHITITFLPGQDLANLHADRGQIEQILMNLCLNAKDAMPNGGQITISSKNVVFDQEFCRHHTWAKPGSYVQLGIADTGCGMDEKTLGHLYEPFFTTKDVGKGTGLGLATVYGIVKQHGGLIHTYSEVNKGTLFKVYLPQGSANLGAAPVRQFEGAVHKGQETILLAEDAEPVCKLAKKLLEKVGYTVLVARDGREALRVYAENADRVDMLLLDVVMPQMGGRAVFERIRRERPDIAVLFASGYSGDSIHTGFVLDEGVTLIQKPYNSETLLRNVREVLDNRAKEGFQSGTNGII